MLNITATAVAGISLVSASNEEMPCLTALKLTNDSDEAISNVKAVISFEPEIADAKTVTFSYVEAHATAFASPLALRHFRFDPAFFFTIDKKTEGKIAIKVYRESDAQNPIAETDVPIEILPYDAWGGIGYLKYSHLAAFVNPQMEAIKRLAGYADDILKKTKGKSLDAYQGDSGDVVNQIGAAFEAIHEQKIFTTDMPVPYNDTATRIRLPESVIKEGKGSYLDLAVLFASLLEAIGLHPVIALKENLAYVGAFLDEFESLSGPTEDSQSQVMGLVQTKHLVLIDAKTLSESSAVPFESAAVALKGEDFDANAFFMAVDISLARKSGIAPLPVDIDSNSGKPYVKTQVPTYDFASPITKETQSAKPNEPVTGFDIWERDLLDLNMANPLLSMRAKSSIIPILCGDSQALAKALVPESSFELCYNPMKVDLPDDPYQTSEASAIKGITSVSIGGKKLFCLGADKDISDRAKKAYRKAKDDMEETGTNSLFLALGALKYSESNKSRASQARYAPLVLVPCDLVRSFSTSAYKVQPRDEDWLVNTTLFEFLKKDSKIDLTDLEDYQPDEDGAFDVNKIFADVAQAIGSKPDWHCYPNFVGLGCFDFNHYIMWNDIRLRKDRLEKNGIVASLAYGKKLWSNPTNAPDIKEWDCCIPLPADSSQINAVEACAKGDSFILFGPPGTGKSQTIVNMIANSLFQGKKVLFVSEKRAALDVVYDRLKAIGLDPFCLQLHSNQAEKSQVIQQFDNAFQHARLGKPEDFEWRKAEIVQTRDKLVGHMKAFGEPGPCYVSINEAFQRFERYRQFKDAFAFEPSFLTSLNKGSMEEIRSTLQKIAFVAQNGAFGEYADNPLLPLKGTAYGLQAKETLSKDLDRLIQAGNDLKAKLDVIKATFPVNFDFTKANVKALFNFSKNLLDPQKTVLLNSSLSDASLGQTAPLLSAFLADLSAYQAPALKAARAKVSMDYLTDPRIPEAEAEVEAILNGRGLFKKHKANKIAKKALKPHIVGSANNKDATAVLKALAQSIALRQKLKANENVAKSVYGILYKGIDDSDAEELTKILSFNQKVFASLDFLADQSQKMSVFMSLIYFNTGVNDANLLAIRNFLASYAAFALAKEDAKTQVSLDLDELPDTADWLSKLPKALGAIQEKLPLVGQWAVLNGTIEKARAMGLSPAIDAMKAGKVRIADLPNAFEANVFLDIALYQVQSKGLEGFNGLGEEATITKYNDDVKLFRDLSLAQLKYQLSANIPTNETTAAPTSELGFLKKAIATNARGKSIRSVISTATNLIKTLCPCFLMSPMSVATYLSTDNEPFDIVIFDEASQIPTSEAIGSISRGKSLVVCGDSNQLPPTSFFKVGSEDVDFTAASLPSVLEDCKSIMLPEMELRWHYRSKSESLIAFSNHEFYNNSLFTFPSINEKTSMVKYIKVDGFYDRAKSRTNPAEANAIVQEILRRKADPIHKKESIGVVAFSQAQRDLIQDKLDDAFGHNPAIRKADEESPEPVFVKNLENVQGDERDVIMFSIGYGKDANGKMALNFGPLNGDNGFRRLNVAVSRAKREMLVFTNIDPDEFSAASFDSSGVQYLFKFLSYAKHGNIALTADSNAVKLSSSLTVDQMADALKAKGYKVDEGVGNSAFRIDLALLNQDDPSKYLLGVIVRGDKPKDFPLVDLTQVQPAVLKGLGWAVLRVYAFDWFNSPEAVLMQIENAYRDALKKYQSLPKKAKESPIPVIEPKPKEAKPKLRLVPDEKPASLGVAFRQPVYKSRPRTDFVPDAILPVLKEIVEAEAPISQKALQKTVMGIYGIARMGVRDKSQYDMALDALKKYYLVTYEADGTPFFWRPDDQPNRWDHYRTHDSYPKDINDVAKEEMAVALADALKANYAPVEKTEAARELLSLYGKSRISHKILPKALAVIEWAVKNRPDAIRQTEDGKVGFPR